MDRNLSELCKDCKENKMKHCTMNFCMNNCGVPLDILTVYERLRTESPLFTSIFNRRFVMDNHILPKLQPCEDAINRKAFDEALYEHFHDEDAPNNITEITLGSVRNFLKDFPPVTPAHKKGHWIMKHRTHNEMKHYTGQDEMGETHTISVLESYEVDEPYCSECGKLAGDTSQNYCCACGAEMQGVEE